MFLVSSLAMKCPVALALPNLERLQKKAVAQRGVTCAECMVHEYSRRYNEVLREYSRRERQLSEHAAQSAHAEAMKWVRSVWQYVDRRIVEENINSSGFQRATSTFRQNQNSRYPNVGVVH